MCLEKAIKWIMIYLIDNMYRALLVIVTTAVKPEATQYRVVTNRCRTIMLELYHQSIAIWYTPTCTHPALLALMMNNHRRSIVQLFCYCCSIVFFFVEVLFVIRANIYIYQFTFDCFSSFFTFIIVLSNWMRMYLIYNKIIKINACYQLLNSHVEYINFDDHLYLHLTR